MFGGWRSSAQSFQNFLPQNLFSQSFPAKGSDFKSNFFLRYFANFLVDILPALPYSDFVH